MSTHGLERTSRGPFLGRCVYCGVENLTMSAALLPCDKAPSQDQQVVDAIEQSAAPPPQNVLTYYGVFCNEEPYAAYPSRAQAEVYCSGFSKPCEIRTLSLAVPAPPSEPPRRQTDEAMKCEAIVTAFETLQAHGYYLHKANGDCLDKQGFIDAMLVAMNGMLKVAAPSEPPADLEALFIDEVGSAFDQALHCDHTKSANLWCYWPNSDPTKACAECRAIHATILRFADRLAALRASGAS